MNKFVSFSDNISSKLISKKQFYFFVDKFCSCCYLDLLSIEECEYISHIKNLTNIIGKLIPKLKLNQEELFIIAGGIVLHDIGLKFAKKQSEVKYKKIIRNHHYYSKKYVFTHYKKLGLTKEEARIIGNLCIGHRTNKKYFKKYLQINGENIRFNLLLSLLRFADQLDLKSQKILPGTEYTPIEKILEKNIKKISLEYTPEGIIILFEVSKDIEKRETDYLIKRVRQNFQRLDPIFRNNLTRKGLKLRVYNDSLEINYLFP